MVSRMSELLQRPWRHCRRGLSCRLYVQGTPAAAHTEAVVPEAAAVASGGNAVELGLETVGALDLGGSSLEVTFMPSNLSQQEATSEASPKSLPMRTT